MVGVHVTFCSYNGSIDVFKTHFTREKSTVIEAEIYCCQTPSQSQSVKTVPGIITKAKWWWMGVVQAVVGVDVCGVRL